MRIRRTLCAAGLVLAAASASILPIACGGGIGGIGVGIATIGISAVLSGTSPGWNVRDPNFTLPTTGGSGVSASATPEPAFTISQSDSLDRVIVAGGGISSPNNDGRRAIFVRGSASGSQAGSVLLVELQAKGWDDPGTFAPTIATGAATIGATTTAFTIALDFTSIPLSGNRQIVGFETNPGDQLRIRFTAQTGNITLQPSSISVQWTSVQTRQTRLSFNSGGELDEDDRGKVVFGGTPGPVTLLIAFGRGSIDTGVNQATLFQGLATDSNLNAVANTSVRFSAQGIGATQTATVQTDSEGIASVLFAFPAAGTATVAATALDAQGQPIANQISYTVNVAAQQVRSDDLKAAFLVSTSGTAQIDVDVDGVTNGLSGTPGLDLSVPDSIEYSFAKDVTTTSEWRIDLLARTASNALTATATFRVSIFQRDATGARVGGLVAQSGVLSVATGLQRFTTFLQHFRDVTITGDSQTPQAGGFDVEIQVLSSSDGSRPGVEILADAPPFNSLVFAPGPTVFATFSGVGRVGRVLGSCPDPRR